MSGKILINGIPVVQVPANMNGDRFPTWGPPAHSTPEARLMRRVARLAEPEPETDGLRATIESVQAEMRKAVFLTTDQIIAAQLVPKPFIIADGSIVEGDFRASLEAIEFKEMTDGLLERDQVIIDSLTFNDTEWK